MSVASTELRAAADRCQEEGNEESIRDFKRILESADLESAACESLLLCTKALLDPTTAKGQELLELVGWDLPAAIASFVPISSECRALSLDILKCLAQSCPPRETLTTFTEALNQSLHAGRWDSCVALLNAVQSALSRIQRRRAECVKEAVTCFLSVAKASSNSEEDVQILVELVKLSPVLQQMCDTEQQEQQKELLRKILAAYVLSLMTLIEYAQEAEFSASVPQLANTLKLCGLGPKALLSERVGDFIEVLSLEDAGLEIKCGAYLAALLELKHCDTEKICQLLDLSPLDALSRLSSMLMLLSQNNLWESAEWLIDIIQAMALSVGAIDVEGTSSILPVLQVLQSVAVMAPVQDLRKSAFMCLVKILKAIPMAVRFDYVVFLTRCRHTSMVALLLTLVKDELHSSWPSKSNGDHPFVTEVLNLLDNTLRPAGGLPRVPEDVDVLVAALNLYRYLLIREQSEGTNHTSVRCRHELQKAKLQWLEPLRYAIDAAQSSDQSVELALAIDSLRLVLHRCLELIEEELKEKGNTGCKDE